MSHRSRSARFECISLHRTTCRIYIFLFFSSNTVRAPSLSECGAGLCARCLYPFYIRIKYFGHSFVLNGHRVCAFIVQYIRFICIHISELDYVHILPVSFRCDAMWCGMVCATLESDMSFRVSHPFILLFLVIIHCAPRHCDAMFSFLFSPFLNRSANTMGGFYWVQQTIRTWFTMPGFE